MRKRINECWIINNDIQLLLRIRTEEYGHIQIQRQHKYLNKCTRISMAFSFGAKLGQIAPNRTSENFCLGSMSIAWLRICRHFSRAALEVFRLQQLHRSPWQLSGRNSEEWLIDAAQNPKTNYNLMKSVAPQWLAKTVNAYSNCNDCSSMERFARRFEKCNFRCTVQRAGRLVQHQTHRATQHGSCQTK